VAQLYHAGAQFGRITLARARHFHRGAAHAVGQATAKQDGGAGAVDRFVQIMRDEDD